MFLNAPSDTDHKCGGTSFLRLPMKILATLSVKIGRRLYGLITTQNRPEYVWESMNFRYF